jgi:NADP-dependent aldehyde dehydrogenase
MRETSRSGGVRVIQGCNFIGSAESREGSAALRASNPAAGEALAPVFAEATGGEVERAASLAEAAFGRYGRSAPAERARFLGAIGEHLVELGDALLERAQAETALPTPRLLSERGRTVGQLGMFAALVEEGSWVDARIDRAQPHRQPLPKPDLRRMLVPLGPVAVFGSSNFPLAFSVAGGDTASALAAGCPVVVKAHPAHPGTSELVARAILDAARATGMPDGVFSMLHGASHEVGLALVGHPAIRAVGFTGSLRGGRALFDAAAQRREPIPVFAEMGSSNPVFLLPGALRERGEAIAKGFAASVTLGCGQFCTNPGLGVATRSPEAEAFQAMLAAELAAAPAGTLVHAGIQQAYERDLAAAAAVEGVMLAARASHHGPNPATEAQAALLVADAAAFMAEPRLAGEIYGPATLLVRCGTNDELLALARGLRGHLTATIHGSEADLAEHAELVAILRDKVGRLVLNAFPTGVEVCPSMQHGGPYPATTDPRSTSVGTAAILRFARPVAYQGFPDALLPEELRGQNPRGIWRLVDGALTRDPL